VTADEYLAAFATEAGVPAPSAAEAEALLKLASVAAHASARSAAPLACYMGGVSGLPIAELVAAAERAAGAAA
jgi:hypothetical protein